MLAHSGSIGPEYRLKKIDEHPEPPYEHVKWSTKDTASLPKERGPNAVSLASAHRAHHLRLLDGQDTWPRYDQVTQGFPQSSGFRSFSVNSHIFPTQL